jgi:hypothetical protein
MSSFFAGRRNDHFLHAAVQMLLRVFSLRENASRLDHNLGANRFPVNRSGIALREHSKLIVLNLDPVLSGSDRS